MSKGALSKVTVNTLVAGLVSMTTVALAAVVILTGLGRGNEALVAVVLGFVGTNVTALMGLYQSSATRQDLKNGAVKEPVKEAIHEVLLEDGNNELR